MYFKGKGLSHQILTLLLLFAALYSTFLFMYKCLMSLSLKASFLYMHLNSTSSLIKILTENGIVCSVKPTCLTQCLTWVSLTEGRVSLPEVGVGLILGISPPGMVIVTPPRVSGLSWEPVVNSGCREMGLCGPLLEPEEDRRLINAISTVGSGLSGYHMQSALKTFYKACRQKYECGHWKKNLLPEFCSS